MKGKRYSGEKVIAMLKEVEAGSNVNEVTRRHGVSAGIYYKWKPKSGGVEVSDARRLRMLEDENRKLKKLVADQALDNMVLKDIL
ncbi:MAG: transposase [Verrucomicrobiota bacterium]